MLDARGKTATATNSAAPHFNACTTLIDLPNRSSSRRPHPGAIVAALLLQKRRWNFLDRLHLDVAVEQFRSLGLELNLPARQRPRRAVFVEPDVVEHEHDLAVDDVHRLLSDAVDLEGDPGLFVVGIAREARDASAGV